jgi:hypothetical protein
VVVEHGDAYGQLMKRKESLEFAAIALIATATLLGLSRLDSTVYNNYVLLASAFLHGHVWIVWPGTYIDALGFHGKHYVIEGPVPALLLMPVVAIFGTNANQTEFACVSAGIAVAAAWLVARRMGADLAIAAWTTAFFAFGTSLAWCAMYGAVWYVAHTVAAMFAMLAVAELVGRRRLWLVALFVVLAAGSRFTLILALPALVAYLLATLPARSRPRALLALACVLCPAAALYVAYNYARWGLPSDIGYVTWYHNDEIGESTGSPFRLEYFSYELQAFFASIPAYTGKYPWLVPDYGAVSIEITSPALLLAAFARGNRGLLLGLLAATLLVAAPSFLYYANGGAQWGMRHALDFIPFLFPLVVLGAMRAPRAPTYLLCGASIAVGLWGLWYWRAFYDHYLVH